MGYDLYYYASKRSSLFRNSLICSLLSAFSARGLTEARLLPFVRSYGNFPYVKKAADGLDVVYLNKQTGTVITLKYHSDNVPEIESRFHVSGARYTGLSISIDYLRPAYFAYEAARLIDAICARFNVGVLDPRLGPVLHRSTTEAMIRSWERENLKAVKEALSGRLHGEPESDGAPGLPTLKQYMSRDRSMIWWKYMYHKNELTRAVREHPIGVYVPEWKIIRKVGDRKLLLAMTLTEGMGYVMPPCDVFLVKRNKCREVGVVETRVLLEEIRESLKPWSFMGQDFNVLTSPCAKSIASALKSVPLESIGNYEKIPPGYFIDVEPSM